MSFVICDTNIFISLFRDLRPTVDALTSIGSDNVLITSISVMELYRGMQNKVEMIDMQKKINNYNILQINEDVSKKAIQLISQYKLSHNLEIPDAIIGAMSIVFDIPLFTTTSKILNLFPD